MAVSLLVEVWKNDTVILPLRREERKDYEKLISPHLRPPYLKYLFHAAVFTGLLYAGVKFLDGGETWTALRTFNFWYTPLILCLSLIYLLVKGWRFVVLLREVRSTCDIVVLRGYMAAQAATLIPGGVAARAGILEQAGVPMTESAAAIAHSSMSDYLLLLACAALSALWFDSARGPVLSVLGVLTLLTILLGIQATRNWLVGVIEWILKRVNLLRYWRKLLRAAGKMASPQTLIAGVANATLACALMVEALHLCVQGVGANVSYPTLLLAFTLPSLLGRISAMPGGVGVTEAGMIGVIDAAPGITREQAAAAVIVFRLCTVLFAALVGAIIYLVGWKGEEEQAVPVDDQSA